MNYKENEFIQKLIKQTLNNKITWKDTSKVNLQLPNDERVMSKLYYSNILDKKFRIYQYQYKHYIDYDEWSWNQRIRLELVDSESSKLYEFEYNYALNDLFNAVTKTTSGIENFIDDFLK